MTVDPLYDVVTQAEAGETVWDDLTGRNTRILRVSVDESGNLGYWLESDYLGGGRFPWEISPPRESGSLNEKSVVR